MSQSEILYQLQQYDSELDNSSSRIKEIDTLLNDREELNRAISIKDDISVSLTEKQRLLKQAENDVDDQAFKVDQNQKKLYSGVVTNPKELEDLQQESEALHKFLSVLEERQLEAMFAADQVQKEYDQAVSQVEKITENLKLRDDDLLAEKSKLEKILKITGEARQKFIESSDIPEMSSYQALRNSLNGIAVALMVANNCSSCGSSIPSAIAQEVRSPGKTVNCPTCKRILHPG